MSLQSLQDLQAQNVALERGGRAEASQTVPMTVAGGLGVLGTLGIVLGGRALRR